MSVAIPQFMKKIEKSLYGTVRFTVSAAWGLTACACAHRKLRATLRSRERALSLLRSAGFLKQRLKIFWNSTFANFTYEPPLATINMYRIFDYLTLFIFSQISYTETIFSIAGSSLSPNGSAIIVGVIQVFGSCLSTAFMERIGRRPLFLTSAAGMGVCHFVIGVFCYLKTLEYDVTSFSWIPVVALSVFMITYALGLGPGPYVIAADILSQDISSLVTTIGMFFAWSMAFLVAKLFPTCVSLLDVHGCFFLLAAFCAATFVFIFTILPETKGQPRQLILDRLNGRVNKKQYVLSSNIIGKNMSPSESI